MREPPNAFLPRDRLASLASGQNLSAHATGSILFADISGFTPLTEAYEVHLGSRRGGEELARVLNEVYALLIGRVEWMGGSVIGFAGDAITCWFDGDDGRRAVACGLAMQEGMAQFAALASPGGGTIALRLKAAVSYGAVRRLVVGDPGIQKVDVIAGDAVYRVAEAEQLARPGEVVIDSQTRQALGAQVELLEERRGPLAPNLVWVVRSIEQAPAVEPWPAITSLEIPGEALAPWIMLAIRERIGSGFGEFFTELRPATALFAAFEGIDFERDPAADRKLDRFFAGAQRIVAEYEGILHQLTLGDKGSFLYAAFGAPVSHEDDTRRAMAAALRLRDEAVSLGFLRSIRIGIGRGLTRTGAYGGPTRRTYGVLGDQVNLAARLMGKAKPWQILVSEAAAGEGKQTYQLQAVPPFLVKGKAQPVVAYALKNSLREPTRAPVAYGTDMVGRREELAHIEAQLMQAKRGYGQVVSIISDVGLGKTRLIHEAARMADACGFQALSGECQSFGANTLYTPWWTIWRQFFGLRGDESPQEASAALEARIAALDPRLIPRLPLLAPVLNIALPDNELTRSFDAKLRRASLESLLVECLRAATLRQPLLIVLEDAHAIDEVSRDLLRSLVQALARLPVLILIARRPSAAGTVLSSAEESLDYNHALELKEFTAEECAELINRKYAQLLGREEAIPPPAILKITERTGGNPFFIEEVMNWMSQRGIAIGSAEAFGSTELPVSLHALVLSRMDQLDESSRVTMKVASVIGRVFRAAVLWGVSEDLGGEDNVRQALEKLVNRDFAIRADEGSELAYLFKHVVIHEVAYESLPHQLRQRLHETIGHFIESHFAANTGRALDALAFHFGRSANREKQREYFLKAGDAARAAYANAAAAAYYRSAIPLLGEAEQIPVIQNLGRVLEVAGDWQHAMESYRQALRLATEQNRACEAAHARLDIGDLLRKSGSYEEAARWLAEAKVGFEEIGDPAGIAQAFHSSGTLAAQTGRYDQAKELYTRSMEIRRRLGDESKTASLLSNNGIIARFQGNLAEALALQEESLAIRKRLNDPWAIGNSLNNLAVAKRYIGDLSGARADLEAGLPILRKVGDRAEIANALNSLAEVALDQRDATTCAACLQESLRLTCELGNLRAIAFLFETCATNALLQERPARCLRLIGAARTLRQAIGAPLPAADQTRMAEVVERASQSLSPEEAVAILADGAELPLSAALDFAQE
jgi:adenylate cyclase